MYNNFNENEIKLNSKFDLNEATTILGLRRVIVTTTVATTLKSVNSGDYEKFSPEVIQSVTTKVRKFIKQHNIFDYLDIINFGFTDNELRFFQSQGKYILMKFGTVDEQLIDPKEFVDISEFCGMSTSLVLHPHMWLAYLRMVEKYTPTSDTLVAIQCGASKPYSDIKSKNWILHGCFLDKPAYDVCFLSVVPIIAYPIDCTVCYPFYFYEAGHFVSEDMENFEENTSKVPLFLSLLLKKKYKKVVLVHNGRWNDTLYPNLKNMLQNTNIELVNATPQSIIDKVQSLFNNRAGITKSRILNTTMYKDHFKSLFPELKDVDMRGSPEQLLAVNHRRKVLNEKNGVLNPNITMNSNILNSDW